jgi:hypothetical protein
MKKILLFTMILLLAGTTVLFAINPIPSYGTKVTFRANFQEKNNGTSPGEKERRQMNIQTSTASSGKSQGSVAVVYVYRLQGHKAKGPFYVHPGELLTVEINNKKWGVAMELLDPGAQMLANVWIEGNSKSVTLDTETSDQPY